MAFKLLDRARMSVSGTPGTGNISLGTATTGYQTFFQAGVVNNDEFPYVATDGTAWEYGVATYIFAGNQLSRDVTKTSAQNNSPLSLSSNAIISACIRAEDVEGSTTLAGLSDVNITPGSAIDGQVVYWNNTDGRFETKTVSGGGGGSTTLASLTDVNVTEGSGINGWSLNWNNATSKWIATAPVSPGATALSGLSDVSLTSLTSGQVLEWNGTHWTNATASGGSALTISNNGTVVDSAATTINFVNATSITTSSHDVTVTLPTGGGSSNSPPSTSTFSTTANGSSVTSAATYTSGKALNFARTDTGPSGDHTAFIGKAVPASTPWHATMQFKVNAIGSPLVRSGLTLYNSSTNQCLMIGLNSGSGTPTLCVLYYASLDALTTVISNITSYDLNIPEWFRIGFDGTTYSFYVSWDDVNYYLVNTATAASYFTATHIGASVETYGSISIAGISILNYYET